jgi:NADH:ubiquinone oxidoreductase subunit C
MYFNYKLYFTYLLNYTNNVFFKLTFKNKNKINTIFINKDYLYFINLHLKLSSLFYSTQLVDIFSYETNTTKQNLFQKQIIITFYNYHILNLNEKIYLFTLNYSSFKQNINLNSVTELFSSANWLEREVSELHGILFLGKTDIRNLLLQYGDSTMPFQKIFPVIGIYELYYNTTKDTLVQQPVTFQL